MLCLSAVKARPWQTQMVPTFVPSGCPFSIYNLLYLTLRLSHAYALHAMELDTSLSWLALALTPGLASRLSARLLKRFGSPDAVFRAPLSDLEGCRLPAPVAQSVYKKEAFKRAEKELKAAGNIDRCRLLNWTEPEYPQTLLQIYDPPVLLYVRGDTEVLNLPSLSIVGTRKPTLYGTQMAERLGRDLAPRQAL